MTDETWQQQLKVCLSRDEHTSSTLKTESNGLYSDWLYDDNVIYMQLIPSKIASCR